MSKYTQLITEFNLSKISMVEFCITKNIDFNAFKQAVFREKKRNASFESKRAEMLHDHNVTSNVTSNDGNTSPGEKHVKINHHLGMRHMIKNEKISLDDYLNILKTNPSLAKRIDNQKSLGEITLIYYILKEQNVL